MNRNRYISYVLGLVRSILYRVLRTRYTIATIRNYDYERLLRYSGALHQDNYEQKRAALTMAYHVIEKGLTMPNKRLGFGQQSVQNLIRLCRLYSSECSTTDATFLHAIAVLKAYLKLHLDNNYILDDNLDKKILDLTNTYSHVLPDAQLKMSKECFFAASECPFPLFAASRHTCRHFNGSVPNEKIANAVKLANLSPSACNRQHTRVHCISDKAQKEQLLAIQNGNRGFGCDADKLLLITTDLHDMRWIEERNDVYTNAGIFIMSLCYALHYEKIAHCILNWSVPPAIDMQMRNIINIPDNESLVCIIACGDAPDVVEIASSPRKSLNDIFTIH